MNFITLKKSFRSTVGYYWYRFTLNKAKVFAVGFNKSGTYSMHTLFLALGFRSYHGIEWRDCENLKLFYSYECFTDGPPKNIPKIDRLFPGSKYIWQVRDLESWIYSRLAHIERLKTNKKNYITSDKWDTTEKAIKHWIKVRNKHHLNLYSYFENRPSDILMVNIIRDDFAATKISNFLGYQGAYKTPKKNRNPKNKVPAEHTEMFQNCVSDLNLTDEELGYDIYCPTLVEDQELLKYPADSKWIPDGKLDLVR